MGVRDIINVGDPKTIALGDPAAGAEYAAQSVPANKAWIVVGFKGTLVTAVAAATRFFKIDEDDGTDVHGGGVSSASQIASLTREYTGSVKRPGVSADIHISVTLPGDVLLAGDRVVFTTVNIQAADDWGPGFLRVYEFDDRNV